ncbi:MAG TPA: OmpA family protein [Lacibacter sp.]|nr:OmpA family protein [Lacibacter sp.]HMO89051.1 OmpA family protein [Lacibacter sp.]
MKQLLQLFFALCVLYSAQGQNNDHKKLPSFGVHFSAYDFATASDLRTKSLAKVLDEKNWTRLGQMSPALTLSYSKGITNNADFMGRLTTTFLKYPLRNPSPLALREAIYLETDALMNLKLLSDKYIVVPYLQGGLSAALSGPTFMASIPLGAGLQFKLLPETFLQLNTNYRVPVTNRANYSLQHSIGFVSGLTTRKVEEKKLEVPLPEPPKDRDGDGVLDDADECPDVKGLAQFKGCPDTDGDGIPDKDDKCPNEKGIAKYNGCPIPDTDGDGINDENDKCPTVRGVARYDGCPVPDSDGDGVNDEEDKCPGVAGTADNYGCPAIPEFSASAILFQSGSAVLLPAGRAELDKVVTYLNENAGFEVDINGHTDNTGSDKVNVALSTKRAEAAKSYLVRKGIDASRLFAAGFGSSQPVADNGTSAGKQQNRRVEVKIRK